MKFLIVRQIQLEIIYQIYGLILFYADNTNNCYSQNKIIIKTNINKKMSIDDFVKSDDIDYSSINDVTFFIMIQDIRESMIYLLKM